MSVNQNERIACLQLWGKTNKNTKIQHTLTLFQPAHRSEDKVAVVTNLSILMRWPPGHYTRNRQRFMILASLEDYPDSSLGQATTVNYSFFTWFKSGLTTTFTRTCKNCVQTRLLGLGLGSFEGLEIGFAFVRTLKHLVRSENDLDIQVPPQTHRFVLRVSQPQQNMLLDLMLDAGQGWSRWARAVSTNETCCLMDRIAQPEQTSQNPAVEQLSFAAQSSTTTQ